MLREMKAAGYLNREARIVSGTTREYYTASEAGVNALDEVGDSLLELSGELFDGRTPKLPPPSNDNQEEIQKDESAPWPAAPIEHY